MHRSLFNHRGCVVRMCQCQDAGNKPLQSGETLQSAAWRGRGLLTEFSEEPTIFAYSLLQRYPMAV